MASIVNLVVYMDNMYAVAAVPKPHVRRTPEAARQHILDAADRVFATELPDQVGLREIAKAARVSHGLVTHYFGTYDALISEVIERRLGQMRTTAYARLATMTFAPTESPLIDVLMDMLDDRTLMRLLAWSLLSHRADAILGKDGAMGKVIDGVHARLQELGSKIERERIELTFMMSISMVLGWSLAGPALERGAGRTTPYDREQLRRELHRMMRAYMEAP